MSRKGGIIWLKANGVQWDAKGNFTTNVGANKVDSIMGADRRHGTKETPQAAFIEGEITKGQGLKIRDVVSMRGANITIQFGDGTVFMLNNADYTGDGNYMTEEGNLKIRFEGDSAEEINP